MALCNIQKQSPRSIRDVRSAFTGQSEANIVLRQQHVGNPLPVFRLVVTYPKQFGQREIGKGCIAGELDETIPAEKVRQFPDLRFPCADLAPDERR